MRERVKAYIKRMTLPPLSACLARAKKANMCVCLKKTRRDDSAAQVLITLMYWGLLYRPENGPVSATNGIAHGERRRGEESGQPGEPRGRGRALEMGKLKLRRNPDLYPPPPPTRSFVFHSVISPYKLHPHYPVTSNLTHHVYQTRVETSRV